MKSGCLADEPMRINPFPEGFVAVTTIAVCQNCGHVLMHHLLFDFKCLPADTAWAHRHAQIIKMAVCFTHY